MKIASLEIGDPDGRLVVVSDDLTSQWFATDQTLSEALWRGCCAAEPQYYPFDPTRCAAPLPRSPNFLDGSAYVNHVELVRRARGAQMPESFWTDPLMYQGLSVFAAPYAPIRGREAWGIDFEAEVAIITRAVPMGVSSKDAVGFIAFVMLLNDVSLRNLIPAELAKGFGFVQSKPISACSPVAVTPDALPGWDGRKLHGVLNVNLNGEPFGRADAGVDMTFDFGDLIAHAAKTRDLPSGTVIGSGTISNKGADGPGRPICEGGVGYSCIAEQRTVETLVSGAPKTPFLVQGDLVEIWMEDVTGRSIFGTISQKVETI
jgi:fumarylacetoacetate (FAA) hydrolase